MQTQEQQWLRRAALAGLTLVAAIPPLALLLFSQTVIPSIAYTIPDRGGISLMTDGAPASTRVGYTVIQPNSSQTTPAGIAIFGFRQNNVLVAEAGVPASPLIQSGRIYAEVAGRVNTGVAIANQNDQPATVTFFFTDGGGANFGSGTTTIPANGQIASFLNESPFKVADTLNGTFTFSSSLPISVIALRGYTNERSEFLITTLPIASLNAGSDDTVIFPHFADGGGWSTQIVLVNPSDETLTGTIRFSGQGTATAVAEPVIVTVDNQTGSSFPYSIAPRSARRFRTLGQPAIARVGTVRAFAEGGTKTPSGLAIFSLTIGGITVTEAGVPVFKPASALRLYAQASGVEGSAGSVQTAVAVANPSPTAVMANFELSTLDGAATGLTGTATVPAGGQVAMSLKQIQGFAALPPFFEGVLRISTTSSAGLAVIGLRNRYNERNEYLVTTTPPVDENAATSSAPLIFPHVADGGGYTTQFILYSASPGLAATGNLRFISETGGPLDLALRSSNSSCPSPVTSATLATGVRDPLAVATDSTYVYFGNTHGVLRRVPKTGGSAQVLATLSTVGISGIAVDDTRVYFATGSRSFDDEGSSIYSYSKNEGALTLLARSLNNVIQVAIDNNDVYWASMGTLGFDGINRDSRIQRVAKSGGAVETIASDLALVLGLALDGNDIYFGELGLLVEPASATTGIRKVAKSGGAITTITDTAPGGFVATDANFVYFTSLRVQSLILNGGIFRAPKSGGAASAITARMALPVQVAFHDGKLFTAGVDVMGENGVVQVSDASGENSRVLKSSLSWAGLFAIDECAVYASTKNNGGSIERISR
jgi:hypothetical protein